MGDYDHVFKIIILGDSNVGKTAILNRFADETYYETIPTIGIDYKIKTLEIGDRVIKLQIWDTAG